VRNERGCEGFMILDATAMILRSVDTMRILTALMGWERICCHLTDGIVNEKRVRGQGKELLGEDSLAITMQMDEMVWNEKKKSQKVPRPIIFDHSTIVSRGLAVSKHPQMPQIPRTRIFARNAGEGISCCLFVPTYR